MRGFELPQTDAETLIVASSFSGNTEEALTAFREATSRPGQCLAITTGGLLAKAARKADRPLFTYTLDGPPRSTFGYGLFSLLRLLSRIGALDVDRSEVECAFGALEYGAKAWGLQSPHESNLAKQIASQLAGRAPVIIAADFLHVAARRWATQVNENASQWAFHAALPEIDHNLVVGNSLAVRDLDWFCPALPSGVGVLSQRGASGIDGLISAAAGVASATLAPTTLYLGDVSFLHDLHGLLATRHARGPLVILVANNDGGRIFERLPIAASPAVDEDFERLWVMPHGCSATDLARACGVRSTAADTVAELHDALRAAYEHGGVAVVEARIGRDATGADHTRALPAAHEGAARGGAADHVEIE